MLCAVCVLSAAGGMLRAVYCVLCIVCCPLRVVRLVVYGAVLCGVYFGRVKSDFIDSFNRFAPARIVALRGSSVSSASSPKCFPGSR
jgi:hypothetical protein